MIYIAITFVGIAWAVAFSDWAEYKYRQHKCTCKGKKK